jgi:excisionase family DNA binding protein
VNEQVSTFPIVFKNCISVKDAASHSGYNIQYLRRMLRSGALDGIKIGQMWLIDMESLEAYLEHIETTSDRRCCPR